MNTSKIVNYSFVFSFLIVIIGALGKIMHYPYSHLFLIVGLLSTAVFIGTCVYEITSSKKIEGTEKFMWVVGLLFFAMITGLVYILSARKRIV